MIKLQWYVKQLFPFTYFSVVDRDAKGNQSRQTIFCIWKMWLGRVYQMQEFEVGRRLSSWPEEVKPTCTPSRPQYDDQTIQFIREAESSGTNRNPWPGTQVPN